MKDGIFTKIELETTKDVLERLETLMKEVKGNIMPEVFIKAVKDIIDALIKNCHSIN